MDDWEERKKVIDKAVETYKNIDAPMVMALVQEQVKEIQGYSDDQASLINKLYELIDELRDDLVMLETGRTF